MKKRVKLILYIGVTSVLIVFLCTHLGFNRSDSVGFRLYWHSAIDEIKHGRYYVIAYNGNEFAGLITKRVACLPTETVTRVEDSFYCNGVHIANLGYTTAPDGTPYPQYTPNDSSGVFVLGDSHDSYDSRYFGLLSPYSFKREVHPIW